MADIELSSLEIKTGANTSDKFKLPYNVLSDPPDLSVYAKLAGNNTFTGGQTITGANGGYSINASGYIKGSWLQASAISNKGANTGKVCVFDDNGWIYYRTPAEILAEAGGAKASDVSGKANLSGGNIFKGSQQFVVDDSNSTIETFVVNDSGSGLDVIKVTAGAGLKLNDGFTTSGFIDCQQGARVGDSNEFLSLNYSDINRPVLTISDGAVLNLDGDTGQAGQVCTSSGNGTAPTWTTPAIKSATLTGTTLYLTL